MLKDVWYCMAVNTTLKHMPFPPLLHVGCVHKSIKEGGIFQLMEGVHSLLLQTGPSHSPHFHPTGTDEDILHPKLDVVY